MALPLQAKFNWVVVSEMAVGCVMITEAVPVAILASVTVTV